MEVVTEEPPVVPPPYRLRIGHLLFVGASCAVVLACHMGVVERDPPAGYNRLYFEARFTVVSLLYGCAAAGMGIVLWDRSLGTAPRGVEFPDSAGALASAVPGDVGPA
ncbi:hypothetical protein Mal64_17240 [Pseudobythopirellula maris]|uniref:Uncharacterized protein n=1 Tax=Pseudobythopirellula maris TaxID=2527991 RepID=A0A5C5ZM43_9BACT|nr:hypothetical protein [Pseudobythopirellula maris]TWT88245.1 hypothetical protein Mal64_17240 [Pseudobythopirellula maris]